MSFGPLSLLVPRFNSSIRLRRTCGLELGPAAIWSQNPIFEMTSNNVCFTLIADGRPDSYAALEVPAPSSCTLLQGNL